MVHYWSEHEHDGVTRPTVNIYCSGNLRGSFGNGEVELVNGDDWEVELEWFWAEENLDYNDIWLVADVQFIIGECGEVDCRVEPILQDGAPWVQQGRSFGPQWSFPPSTSSPVYPLQ